MIKELKRNPQEELKDSVIISKLNELIRDYNKKVGIEDGD
jgi:hypothetical protein